MNNSKHRRLESAVFLTTRIPCFLASRGARTVLMTVRPRRLLKTCLGNMPRIGLLPLTPCICLPRTLCTCLRQAPRSPHCKCRLCRDLHPRNPSWSRHKTRMSMPHLLNMILRCKSRNSQIPETPCMFLPRTVCTCRQ